MDNLTAGSVNAKESLVGEILLLGLLGKLLYGAPKQEELQALVEEDVFQDVPLGEGQPELAKGQEYLLAWTQSCQPKVGAQAFDLIMSDWLRLFVGTGSVLAAPWESVYLSEEHLLFQKETLDVRFWFQRYGLQAERLYQEPDDHLGLQLSFLGHLSHLALESLESGDMARFYTLRAEQKQFLNGHLARWVAEWCELVEKNARGDYYRGLAWLALGAVKQLIQSLSSTPESEQVG